LYIDAKAGSECRIPINCIPHEGSDKMAGDRSDLDRLKRIRDQQLSARDPGKKQRKLQQTITHKYRRRARSFSFGQLWAEVPNRWKGTLIGSVFGVIAVIVLPLVMDPSLATVAGFAVLGFLVLMGFLIGRARDAQDDLTDLLR
jgi:hypothetical protein